MRRDPETGQLWTARDNGPEPIKDYDGAERYCKSLDVGGLTGWRLPSFNELSNLWKKFGGHVNFQLSQPNEILWSSTLAPDGVHHNPLTIGEIPTGANLYSFTHALCVHDPSQPKR